MISCEAVAEKLEKEISDEECAKFIAPYDSISFSGNGGVFIPF